MQVAAWYMLSEPVKAQPVSTATTAAAGTSAPADGGGHAAAPDAQHAQQERTTYAQLVEDMIPMGGGRDGPPPALSRQGEFSDWVYTMPTAKYDRNEVSSQSVMWTDVTLYAEQTVRTDFSTVVCLIPSFIAPAHAQVMGNMNVCFHGPQHVPCTAAGSGQLAARDRGREGHRHKVVCAG